MDHFSYKNQELFAEQMRIQTIAEQVGTPFYCYSTATLTRHYHVFADAFKAVPTTICFAIKANSNLSVLKTLAKEGAGGDAVSEGEIRRAIAADIPANKIVFSGVGKTQSEMAYALEEGIMQFNVESENELHDLNQVAQSKGVKAPIAIRINPDVDAKTHAKISTGKKENKFGIAWEQAESMYQLAGSLPHIDVQAISTHIGSQLLELEPFQHAFRKITELVTRLRQQGHQIKRLDLGGGLGIPYAGELPPTPADYAAMTIEAVKHLDCELVFEPGRLIAGNAGILVSSVVYVKESQERIFTILDAAMNDLIRPSLYDAYHEIIPVVQEESRAVYTSDIVGPVCETGDTFCKDYTMQQLQKGELVAFRSAGAYGAVMANTYNSRLLVPEILVKEDQFAVVRPRKSYEALLRDDKIATWL